MNYYRKYALFLKLQKFGLKIIDILLYVIILNNILKSNVSTNNCEILPDLSIEG
jgi:hypothetical protein